MCCDGLFFPPALARSRFPPFALPRPRSSRPPRAHPRHPVRSLLVRRPVARVFSVALHRRAALCVYMCVLFFRCGSSRCVVALYRLAALCVYLCGIFRCGLSCTAAPLRAMLFDGWMDGWMDGGCVYSPPPYAHAKPASVLPKEPRPSVDSRAQVRY